MSILANVSFIVNYYKGFPTVPTDADHFLQSVTGSAPDGSTMQTSTAGATYINLNLAQPAGLSSGTLQNTNLVLSASNNVFNVYYTAVLPTLPPTAPIDPYALSESDTATFYNWITSKYAVQGTTGQPVNNVQLSYPPQALGSPANAGYSDVYAQFISEYNYVYIGGLQGYDPANDWAFDPSIPQD